MSHAKKTQKYNASIRKFAQFLKPTNIGRNRELRTPASAYRPHKTTNLSMQIKQPNTITHESRKHNRLQRQIHLQQIRRSYKALHNITTTSTFFVC